MSATAIDTHVLLYALNASVPEHQAARRFLDERRRDSETVLSELVLVELYVLLRNPAVVARPLDAPAAAAVVQQLRRHPAWQPYGPTKSLLSLLGFEEVFDPFQA